MKKYLFLSFIAIYSLSNAQTLEINSDLVRWGDDYPQSTSLMSNIVYDYIGSIDDVNYYSYVKKSGAFKITTSVGFFTEKKGVIINKSKNDFEFPSANKLDVKKIIMADNQIYLIYTKIENDKIILRKQQINIENFTLTNDEAIASASYHKKMESEFSFFAGENNACFVATLFPNFTLYFFDKTMKLKWSKEYQNESYLSYTINEVIPSVYDEKIYMVGNVVNNEKEKTKDKFYNSDEIKRSVSMIAEITEKDIKEHHINETLPSLEIRIFEIDKDNIFLTYSNRRNVVGLKYTLSNENIAKMPEFTYPQAISYSYWSVDKILKLDNGNIVIACNNDWVLSVINQKTPNQYFYYGGDIQFLCYDLKNESTVYEKMISRAITDVTIAVKRNYLMYEKSLIANDGNTIYVLYNSNRKENDLSGLVFNHSKNQKDVIVLESDLVICNMAKITEDGTISVIGIIPYKEMKLAFSSNISFKKDKTIQINSLNKKGLTFGELKLD